MEEKLQNSSTTMNKIIFPTVIVALIVFSAIGFYLYQSGGGEKNTGPSQPASEQTQSPEVSASVEPGSIYKDGTYDVVGNYVSPGGPRELKVTITIGDGVITQAETVGTATDATSKRFQGEFIGGFKDQVIGKNIDEVSLAKIAGSSLSPKGFNDAVEKVKAEAKS